MLRPAEERNHWRGRMSRKMHLLNVIFLVPVACNSRSERKVLELSSNPERHRAPWNRPEYAVAVLWSGSTHNGAWIVTSWRSTNIAINFMRKVGHAVGYNRRNLVTVGMRSLNVCRRVGKSKSVIET